MKKLSIKILKLLTQKALIKVNVKKKVAETVANGLCYASLRGIDSHGINLLSHYIFSAQTGKKNGNPKLKFRKVFPAFTSLDADDSFGHYAGYESAKKATKLAKKFGVAAISVKNSTHCGALGFFTTKIANDGMIGFAFTNADALVFPPNGKKSLFGTNPLSVCFPRSDFEPICLDMSTSVISWNKLINLKIKKKKIKDYIAADVKGNLTSNPENAVGLFALGGILANYKGFALGSIVELLCSALTGSIYSRNIMPMYSDNKKPRKISHLFLAINKNIFLKDKQYFSFIDNFSKYVYNEESKQNKILLPGDPESIVCKERNKHGVPISDELFKELENINQKLNLKLNLNAK